MTQMRTVCGWCQILLGFKAAEGSQDAGKASHGMCRACWDKNSMGVPTTPEMEAEWAALEASLQGAYEKGLQEGLRQAQEATNDRKEPPAQSDAPVGKREARRPE